MSRFTRFAILACLVACAEAEEARLDHAQILAVRAEPAHIAPGERARIQILAGDDSGAVFEADPETLLATGAQPLAIEHTADGWFVTAGPQPGIVTLRVTLTIDGLEWPASKQLVIDDRAENPLISMQMDGATTTEIVAERGTKPELTAVAVGPGPFTYAWYSSVGDLERYRQPTAILDAADPAEGSLLLVVRDSVGGVSWQLVPSRVE